MPEIIIDIVHPVDINFYKNAISVLLKKNIDLKIITRPRGALIAILENEYNNFGLGYYPIGTHYPSFGGKIFGIFERNIKLLHYLANQNFDVSTSFCGFYIAQVSQILGKKSVVFSDDYEYKLNFYLSKISASRYVIPDSIPVNGSNIVKFKGVKELAYLHPAYFQPNKKALAKYGLQPAEYVFVREVKDVSLNYRHPSRRIDKGIEYLKNSGFEVVASLEDKSLADELRNSCKILEEPVPDIFSILKYAALTISSGDTVARESCVLGTPAIYTGERRMVVNEVFIRKNCLFKLTPQQDIVQIIKHILDTDLKKDVEQTVRKTILYEWDDVTDVIVKNLLDFVKRS
jgi:hypothetical protein